jgi:isochorismate synthase EntC
MSPTTLLVVLCASVLAASCGKSAEDNKAAKDDSAAKQFSADKAADARQREEMARRRQEMEAANQQDIHKETLETFKQFDASRPALTIAEEAKAQDDAVERLRARMPDPASMQVRNVRFNAQKTAVCMEVSYREGTKNIGFRRAFSTPEVTWVEPSPDDVSHRVFELNLEKFGCKAALTGK